MAGQTSEIDLTGEGQTKPKLTGIVGAAPTVAAPTEAKKEPAIGGIVAPTKIGTDVFGPEGYKFREASAATRTVDPKTGTVSGQLESILAQDGVHMQRTRANALAMAADSGLRNTSIAVGAAQGALIDRATPIATSDAGIYDGAAKDNQAAQNAANVANAQNYNQLGGIMVQQQGEDKRLASQQQFTSKENEATRAQQERIQQLQEQGMDKRQAEQLAQQERLAKEQRDQQTDLFDKEQAAADKRAKENFDNTLKQLGYQNELNNKNIPAQRQTELAMMTTERINQIMSDGNLTPEAKQGAIKNVIDNANATAAMYEKLYNTTIPKFQMPGVDPNATPEQAQVAKEKANLAKGLPATFDSGKYLQNNPDVAAAVAAGQMTAEEHYLRWGYNEPRRKGTWG